MPLPAMVANSARHSIALMSIGALAAWPSGLLQIVNHVYSTRTKGASASLR
jgi:hypothetical protein